MEEKLFLGGLQDPLEKVTSLSLGTTTDLFSCACSTERQRIPTSLTWKSGLISID